jgi:hypothetical protein
MNHIDGYNYAKQNFAPYWDELNIDTLSTIVRLHYEEAGRYGMTPMRKGIVRYAEELVKRKKMEDAA